MEENKLTVGNIVFNRIQETPFIYNEASKLSMPTMRYDITVTPDMIERAIFAIIDIEKNDSADVRTLAKAALEAALGGKDES